jgi:feruloyl esterase
MDFMGMPDPLNLTTVKAKGKLLVYHGTADPVFSSNYTRNWYDKLKSRDASAASHVRLFLVPGMNHCGGGMATDSFDAFTPLVDWVEKGAAPDSINATVASGNTDKPASWSATRSRPLCAYPNKAVLKTGATDLESASSFVRQ